MIPINSFQAHIICITPGKDYALLAVKLLAGAHKKADSFRCRLRYESILLDYVYNCMTYSTKQNIDDHFRNKITQHKAG